MTVFGGIFLAMVPFPLFGVFVDGLFSLETGVEALEPILLLGVLVDSLSVFWQSLETFELTGSEVPRLVLSTGKVLVDLPIEEGGFGALEMSPYLVRCDKRLRLRLKVADFVFSFSRAIIALTTSVARSTATKGSLATFRRTRTSSIEGLDAEPEGFMMRAGGERILLRLRRRGVIARVLAFEGVRVLDVVETIRVLDVVEAVDSKEIF